MNEYFELQYRMINRWFRDNGLEPFIGYTVLIILFSGLSIWMFYKTEYAVYIYLLVATSFIAKLSETNRTEFLRMCLGDVSFRKVRITENFICVFPFIAFLVYKHYFIPAGCLLVIVSILALVNFRTTLNYSIWTPFSKRPFEFTVGFRNTFYLLFAAYSLTIIAVSVDNFNLGVFALLFVFVTSLSYYFNPENVFFVWSYSLNPQQFLLNKIKTAILLSFVLALPVALILAIFYYQNIVLILLLFLGGWAFLTAVIVLKYEAYPNEMNILTGVFLALCLSFPPLLLVLIPYFFRKAQIQLTNFLK